MMNSLAFSAIRTLLQTNNTLSIAESCTGGMIGAMITAIPGSSKVFFGGVIAYSNQVKQTLLGVPGEILLTYGAVSTQTVECMAQGVRRLMNTTCALSISGIAGPDGGTPEKPVGLVFIGISHRDRCVSFRHLFSGERDGIRRQGAETALKHLLDELEK